jgi:hypothetical protein
MLADLVQGMERDDIAWLDMIHEFDTSTLWNDWSRR